MERHAGKAIPCVVEEHRILSHHSVSDPARRELVSLRVQKRTRSIGPYVSSSVSERSAPYAIFSPGWRRMGVRARNDDGLRGTLAAAEHSLAPCSGSSKEAPSKLMPKSIARTKLDENFKLAAVQRWQ